MLPAPIGAQLGLPARLVLYAQSPQSLEIGGQIAMLPRAQSLLLWALAEAGPPGLPTASLIRATQIGALYTAITGARVRLRALSPLTRWLPCRSGIYVLAEPWPVVVWEP
jgi:hypothetical protein